MIHNVLTSVEVSGTTLDGILAVVEDTHNTLVLLAIVVDGSVVGLTIPVLKQIKISSYKMSINVFYMML